MIIGTGIDIIEIVRIKAAIERGNQRFVQRVFTPAEQNYCNAHHLKEIHYAGRFAAKEAALKALGTGWAGRMRWVDVEILSQKSGPPILKLTGAAQERCHALGAIFQHVTISHSQEYAVAMVILER